jgi:hypothetical protein
MVQSHVESILVLEWTWEWYLVAVIAPVEYWLCKTVLYSGMLLCLLRCCVLFLSVRPDAEASTQDKDLERLLDVGQKQAQTWQLKQCNGLIVDAYCLPLWLASLHFIQRNVPSITEYLWLPSTARLCKHGLSGKQIKWGSNCMLCLTVELKALLFAR